MAFIRPKCPICNKRDKVSENYDTSNALTKGKKWFCYRDSLYFNKR